MKTDFLQPLAAVLILTLAPAFAQGGTLTNAGVLANSGEQGKYLVHFSEKQTSGIGMVYDKYGTLWDRGGQGTLNRYALDGRLLATYPIEPMAAPSDKLTHIGDQLILLLNKHVYTLSVDAPAGTKPEPLDISADYISYGSIGSKIAIYQDQHLLLLDTSAKTTEPLIADEMPNVRDFEIKPDGTLIVQYDTKVHLFKDGKEVIAGWPRVSPGYRMQWLEPYWYITRIHGTILRYNADFETDPGVVLGGGSGSFIGHVDELGEYESGQGMAPIGNDTYAISGLYGVIHLVHWNPVTKQMDVVRRIGALQNCRGIAMSSQGAMWVNGGMWNWDDRPDARQINGDPVGSMGQASMLPGDVFAAPATHNTMNIFSTAFTWKLHLEPDPKLTPDFLQGSATYQNASRQQVLLVINEQGRAFSYRMGMQGDVQKELGPVTLHTNPPVTHWTSLAMKDNNTLMAAGDGAIIEFHPDGDNWTEAQRWNSWDSGPANVLGKELYISTDADHLWVSDTQRQRVFCFSLQSEKPIASFGVADETGNDMTHLQTPQVIVGRGNRAAVYDSGNQRIIKLLLSE